MTPPDGAGDRGTALAGLKVVDVSQMYAGGLVGTLMADFGADVIKTEHPTNGDAIRGEGLHKDGAPLTWKLYNRNKKYITLDLGKPEGAEVLKRLVKDADILIENFRPGTMERWGLGYNVLSEVNRRLVMVRVTAFGQTGPHKGRTGFGTLVEAMSGFAHMTGQADGPPTLPPLATADAIAALFGVFSAMFAVYHRDVVGAGVGQEIDVSLLEPMFLALGAQPLVYDQLGIILTRRGNRAGTLRNLYQCSDGRWVAVSGAPPAIYTRVQRVIGGEALLNDERFLTLEGRQRHAEEMDALVADWIRQRPRDVVIQKFEEVEAAIAPVYNTAELMEDPHVKARGSVVSIDDVDLGKVRMQNAFPLMSRTPGRVRFGGPKQMGVDNREVYMGRLGMTEQEMDELKQRKVI